MFGLIKKALTKTVETIASITPKSDKISKDELETLLLETDMSYDIVEKVLEPLGTTINKTALYNSLITLFTRPKIFDESAKPFVELIIGVNGAGKTTSIAKLAYRYKSEGKNVLLGAGDTFRAAAIEQLSLWATKLDVTLISTKQGADPSGVAYDAINASVARNMDRVIIDTAGRLHTQTNLTEEMKKIVRVCDKAYQGAPHRKILVLDGTQGNSAIAQAKLFHEAITIDGIIITKLDGTAKGGALFSVASELGLPILYMGIGEKAEDLVIFDPEEYVETIVNAIFGEK